MSDLLGKQVRLKTLGGKVHAEGVVRWYCAAPTVVIETARGERVYWRADLCEAVEAEFLYRLEYVDADIVRLIPVGRVARKGREK